MTTKLDPDRVLYDYSEMEEVIAERDEALKAFDGLNTEFSRLLECYKRSTAERDAALAKIDELTTELTAYQIGDSDHNLMGEAEWAAVVALRRIEDLRKHEQIEFRIGVDCTAWAVDDERRCGTGRPFGRIGRNNDPQADGKLAAAGVQQWLDRTDPHQALWLSASLLSGLLEDHDLDWSLAAYNGGPGVANEPVSQRPAETQAYVPSVIKHRAWYRELEAACQGGVLA